MGKARKVSLRTRKFEKAGDATVFFATMLNRYEVGDRVSLEDAAELTSLLERHSEYDEQAGNGIVAFEVNVPPGDVPSFPGGAFGSYGLMARRLTFRLAIA